MARRATSRRSSDDSLPSRAGATVDPLGNAREGQGRIWRWTRQNGPVGPFAAESVHTDSTPHMTLARRPRPPGRRSGRRSSERSIPTVCSNPKSALDARRTPEPPISLASPICPLGREQRVRDDLAPGRATSSSIPRMRPTSSGRATTHRLATIRPSGLRHACRRAVAAGAGIWRRTVHRTDAGRCRPATAQCRDFTLNRSADWMQLP